VTAFVQKRVFQSLACTNRQHTQLEEKRVKRKRKRKEKEKDRGSEVAVIPHLVNFRTSTIFLIQLVVQKYIVH
jgi:hypothetical protein